MGCMISKLRALRAKKKARKDRDAPIVLEGLTISDPMPLGPRTEISGDPDVLRLDRPQIVFNRPDDLYSRVTRFGVVAEHVAPDGQKDGDNGTPVADKQDGKALPIVSEQDTASEPGGASGEGGPSSLPKSI
ncbi:hypothetical protein FHETE_240 [Fusarium heterosporum]|uniref:Uncharacterized protein n=1 Tax=Fusarium heterosporum TaxID=42747 RepID=A0A8H5WYY7_FUSHE|nr:hypothetical protein FHETE_240 [Fusarium heterosporum]